MSIPVEIISEGCRIQATFYCAQGDPLFPTALLLPGLPDSGNDVLGLGRSLSQQGINTLTLNYRGTHQSEGIYGLRHTLEDINAAMVYLCREEVVGRFQIDANRLFLGGYSYGGGMALAYASGHAEVRSVFAIAGTDHSEFAREYARNAGFSQMIDAFFDTMRFPTGPVHFEGREPIRELLGNPSPYDLRLCAAGLADRCLLLIGGWDDTNVTIEHHILPLYRALVNAGGRQVRMVALQDDHTFNQHRGELARIVVDWVKSW